MLLSLEIIWQPSENLLDDVTGIRYNVVDMNRSNMQYGSRRKTVKAKKNYILNIRPTDLEVIQYPVYLYTSWKNFITIMIDQRIKGSLPHRCNDLFELLPAWETNDEFKIIENALNNNRQLFFCFSRTARSAPMWGHYANNGRGVVLQFTLPLFKIRAAENDEEGICGIGHHIRECFNEKGTYMENMLLYFINYASQRPKYIEATNLLEYSRLTSTKGKEWGYEQEVRVVMNRNDKRVFISDGMYFTNEFNRYLSAIILGPKTEHDEKYLKGFLDDVLELPAWKPIKQGLKSLKYVTSGVDNKSYTIALDDILVEGGPYEAIPFTRSVCLRPQDIEVHRI